MKRLRLHACMLLVGSIACVPGSVDGTYASNEVAITATAPYTVIADVGGEGFEDVVVTNTSRKKSAILRQVTTNPPFYVDTLTSPISIPPAASVNIHVYFRPTEPGTFSGVLTCLLDRIPDQQIPLTGEARAVQPAPTGSNAAVLVWDANAETDLAGYLVYVRSASASYGEPVATVTTPTFTATGLAAATTYYFTVAAIDASGNESARSNEVSKTFP